MADQGLSVFAAEPVQVRLSHPQMIYLRMVAKRDNHEIDFDEKKYRPDARAMVADLIMKGFAKVVEYTTHALASGRVMLKLTERGCAFAEQLEIAANNVTVVQSAQGLVR